MSDAASIAAAKTAFRTHVENARYGAETKFGFFEKDATINVVHPFNEMTRDGFAEVFLGGLLASFRHLTRSDYIAFGGGYEGQVWVTSTGYYTGHFEKTLARYPPDRRAGTSAFRRVPPRRGR